MKFKINSPTREISPQEIANKITDRILNTLEDKIYEMVEEKTCDELKYIYDVDMDSTNTSDLDNFIYDVYNIIHFNIEDSF